jgi:hypothetical protein
MASTTLCFSGFSRDELVQVQKQFEQANAGLTHPWSLVPESDAQVLVIDMDSMYGHMTWLKAHGGGKTTVALTAGERSEADHLLRRPLDVDALKHLLAQLAGDAGPAAAPAVAAPVASSPAPAAAAPVAEPQAAAPQALDTPPPVEAGVALAAQPSPPAATTPAPAPAPEAIAVPAAAAAPAPASFDPSADYLAAITTSQRAAMAPTVPREPRISDYLPKGVLGGYSKLELAGAPVLAFDPAAQVYAGPATLKPLLPYAEASIREQDFTAIDGAEFERIKAAAGGVHPYMRLLWLCGLSAGRGQLLPGYSSSRKFTLTKWPQIEREFPKHFRLATVMMKGPALIKELVELSGVPEPEVLDFVNAGLVTGAVVVEGTPASPADITRSAAVLARPRAG